MICIVFRREMIKYKCAHEHVISERIPADPSSCDGTVMPIPVVKEIRLVILTLGGESERIGLGHGAGGAEDFPEGAFEASLWSFHIGLSSIRLQTPSAKPDFSETAAAAAAAALLGSASSERTHQTMD